MGAKVPVVGEGIKTSTRNLVYFLTKTSSSFTLVWKNNEEFTLKTQMLSSAKSIVKSVASAEEDLPGLRSVKAAGTNASVHAAA